MGDDDIQYICYYFHAGYIAKYPQWLRRSMCLLIIGLSLAAFIYITRHILYTTAWNRTAKFSLIKQTDMTFARYNELLPKLGDNYLFLYNYAAELNYGNITIKVKRWQSNVVNFGLIIIYNC